MTAASLDLDAFQQQFSRAARHGISSTAREALLLHAARLRDEVRQQFSTEGRHAGTPWPPRKQTRPWPLLRRSDRLFLSLVKENNPAHVERLDVDQRGIPYLLFGTTVSYATFHQTGTRFLPARPLLTPSMLGGSRAQFPL